MAKVGAHWRGFVSAIAIACAAAAVGMWSLGWLDRDVKTIGNDVLSGIRDYLEVDEIEGMAAPERADIYQDNGVAAPGSKPDFSFWGNSTERQLSVHAGRGALIGKPTVIDGDTIHIAGKSFHLWGVDAPELRQPCSKDGYAWACGQDALKALKEFLGNQQIACYEKGLDAQRRPLAQCFAGSLDLGRWQARNGWAMAVRSVSTSYVSTEIDAKYRRVGIWRDSSVEAPWEWRRRH